ncbi:formylglycine-generating enzyme family protein [Desulfamplus magnetovallimortis]|uniref:formylglycine-generating enzyme family protein n=1 Tax=Desulfamplus magnetovallimortis TaxID=1246637 RepID=UPI00111A3A5A|nr:formylglycine-generating enzyme family protein [Desulfamplus magnetovallimortis]
MKSYGKCLFVLIYSFAIIISVVNHETIADSIESKGALEQQLPQNSKKLPQWTEPLTGITFIQIPKGCFYMGSDSGSVNEKPRHRVCIDSFWMAAHEVTNRQFQIFKSCPDSNLFTSKSYNTRSYNTMLLTLNDQPALHVSWNDAMAFIKCLNNQGNGVFRLPTEAEWEYAARAGTTSEWFWGDNAEDACQYANVFDEIGKERGTFPWQNYPCFDRSPVTSPVGSYLPNAFGLYDMLGNVWEWCADSYQKDAYAHHSVNNPICNTGDTLRVFRGGSWNNAPAIGRCASRSRNTPDFSSLYLGFRIVRED